MAGISAFRRKSWPRHPAPTQHAAADAEEFYYALPYAQMDLLLYAFSTMFRRPRRRAASASLPRSRPVYRDIVAKGGLLQGCIRRPRSWKTWSGHRGWLTIHSTNE